MYARTGDAGYLYNTEWYQGQGSRASSFSLGFKAHTRVEGGRPRLLGSAIQHYQSLNNSIVSSRVGTFAQQYEKTNPQESASVLLLVRHKTSETRVEAL